MTLENVYPSAKYEVWICTSLGVRLAVMDTFSSLSFSRAFGAIGRCSITVPADSAAEKLLQADNIIQIWRSPVAGAASLEFAGFIREIEHADQGGKDNVTLRGVDGVSLLKTRIVAYRAGTSQASKSGAADNVMKAIVRENLGASATDAARRLDGYNFSVDADHSHGASISMKFAWRNVLDVLNGITNKTINDGTPIYFDVIPAFTNLVSGWKFITGKNYLGLNRTYSGANTTLFSKEFGNLESPRLVYDYSDEITYAYVGGEGEGSDRELGTAIDTSREERSPWNRREKFVNYSMQESATALTDRAKQEVQSGRPKVRFSAQLKDSIQTKFGVHWKYGDQIVIAYRNLSFDGVVNAIAVSLDENRKETIQARVEAIL